MDDEMGTKLSPFWALMIGLLAVMGGLLTALLVNTFGMLADLP